MSASHPLVRLIGETLRSTEDIRGALSAGHRLVFSHFEEVGRVDWTGTDAILVDAWHTSAGDIPRLATLMGALTHLHVPIFLCVGPSMRNLLARAKLLATINTFSRPLDPDALTDMIGTLLLGRAELAARKQDTRKAFMAIPEHRDALLAADDALERIFMLGLGQGKLDQSAIDNHTGTIIASLAESGIGSWISSVRLHHDSTYQHCLLVTGLAISFGQQLGFPQHDLRRIALGALMHDIGKARIPLAILDKPTSLTPEERGLIEMHPQYGQDILAGEPDVPDELEAIILQHHEYLDGSGYPFGLTKPDLSDIVRLITVADVFGALVERRTYRPSLSGADAYEILLSMHDKLDMAIVRAIRQTAFKSLD